MAAASVSVQAQDAGNLPLALPLETTIALGSAALTIAPTDRIAVPPMSEASPAADAAIASLAPPSTVGAPASLSVRDRAADAAAATLTALLPRLAANDAMPLMDRSTLFAGDLSRLLSHYDLTGGTLAPQHSGGKVQGMLQRALTLLGTPYRWGGTSPDSGFDCSGLVSYVFRTALGIELPRVSREMATKADAELIKSREALQQGDLVFFGRKGRVNHVGIYVGEGRFLHSPSTGKDVRVDSLVTGYWSNKFMQARRVAM